MTTQEAQLKLNELEAKRDSLWLRMMKIEAELTPVRAEWNDAQIAARELAAFIRISSQ